MTTEPSPAAGKAVPTPHDFTVARLTRQRDAAEQLVDTLSAKLAALEQEKADLANKLAEVTAEAAKPQKGGKANG